MQHHPDERKFVEQLRRCRLRATNQRLAIMQALMESRSHPSAEDIYQKLKRSHPTLSLSTVYKTLQVMAEMGTVLTIDSASGSQRFDGNIHPHHHAVCIRCGKVFDIDFGKYPVDLTKPDVLAGFNVQFVKVTFAGTCRLCESMQGQFTLPMASD